MPDPMLTSPSRVDTELREPEPTVDGEPRDAEPGVDHNDNERKPLQLVYVCLRLLFLCFNFLQTSSRVESSRAEPSRATSDSNLRFTFQERATRSP